MPCFTAACIQLSSSDDLVINLQEVRIRVHEAAGMGAHFIALPENAFLMQEQGKPPYAPPLAKHEGVLQCRELAETLQIYLLIGSVAVRESPMEKPYNSSLLIDPQGEITARYDKIHLFDVDLPGGESYRESARFCAGNRAILAGLPCGKLGMTICYDVRFAGLYRALAQAGATMFTIPAAFTTITGAAHWHTLLRARAIENGCFVIAPAQCGTHAGGRKTYGHSLIISPWGDILAQAGESPGIITATLNMNEVTEARSRILSFHHDRKFTLCDMSFY